MSKAIAIDTTATDLIIVYTDGNKSVSSVIDIGKSGHSSVLIPSIKELLKKAETDISEIDTVGVVIGPGSFTGIRIGVSALTAIAFANTCKRVAVTSFELIALNRGKITASVDAGHGNLYVAFCEDGKITGTRFVENGEEFDRTNLVFETKTDRAESLIQIVNRKISDQDYVSIFEPYYMRKSQAEREKDEI